MKILFLDIDGCLNKQDTFSKYPETDFPIDKEMAFLVGKIQLDTDCKVVLSSSWRHDKKSVMFIHERVVPLLDITDDFSQDRNCVRGDEIQAWLDENPEVEKYAILDDDADMLEEQMDNFFETDFETGLTKEIADDIIKHLNE